MEDKLFTLLVEQEDITWKDIIYDLIKTEQLDPWDVDISRLTQKYIETIKDLKKADFKLSGKVLLAAALMLSMKGKRLVGEDLDALDRLIAQKDINEQEFYDDLENATFRDPSQIPEAERMHLVPRTPQPRLRKVSVYDLVAALEKALEVKKRRLLRELPATHTYLPKKSRDISLMIKGLYKHILDYFSANPGRKLHFSTLTPNATKEDKIFTFIPILHLTNERKIDVHQPEHFSDFRIHLIDKNKVRGAVPVETEAEARPADPLSEAKERDKAERKKQREAARAASGKESKPKKAEAKAKAAENTEAASQNAQIPETKQAQAEGLPNTNPA